MKPYIYKIIYFANFSLWVFPGLTTWTIFYFLSFFFLIKVSELDIKVYWGQGIVHESRFLTLIMLGKMLLSLFMSLFCPFGTKSNLFVDIFPTKAVSSNNIIERTQTLFTKFMSLLYILGQDFSDMQYIRYLINGLVSSKI